MSLTDALLLDAAPFEVWIALRGDGQKGSGTQSDPYDGSVIAGPNITITDLNNAGDAREAVATANNTLLDGDVVTVSEPMSSQDAWYGSFPIYGRTSTSFKYYMQSIPAAGAAASSVAKKLSFRFDEAMTSAPRNTTVHIGPGLFQTRGHGPGEDTKGWTVKSGQKIRGAGIEVTTLKLMYAYIRDRSFAAILGGGSVSEWPASFEVSDLTVDCNLQGQLVLKGQVHKDRA